MKQYLPLLIISLLMINTLSGQVKIGDNPQTLHPASILELESNSRVLVITRVTDAEMAAINPLRGAVVYNTDHDCIHYYDGTNWINICEALDNTFTVSTRADFLRRTDPNAIDSTVVVTPSVVEGVPNLNFEVNVINSSNIGQSAVTNSKIQSGSIENRHIQPRTIAPIKFEDGHNIGDLHRWNGFEWVLANESDILITEKDSIIGNEVTNATLNGSLIRSGGGTVQDPFTLDVRDGGIGNVELGTDAVTTDKILDETIVEADIADNAVTSNKIQNETIITDDIADDAITTSKILDGNITEDKIADDAVTLAKIGADPATESNKVLTTDASGDPFWEDRTNFTSSNLTSSNIYVGDVNNVAQGVTMTGDATIIENGTITISEGAVTTDKILDGTILEADIADNAVTTIKILDENITEQKLADNAVTTTKIADGNVTLDKLAVGNNPSDLLQWDGTNWTLISESSIISADSGNNIVAGTDGGLFLDQDATGVDYDGTTSGLTATDAQAAIDELAASNALDLDTDPENELITDSAISAGTITITENGTDHTIDLISTDADNNIVAGTDGGLFLDQDATGVDYDGTTSGLTATDAQAAIDELAASNALDLDTDPENELITDSAIAAGTITITENGTDHTIDLISTDADNNIVAGTDGGLFLDQDAAGVDYDDSNANLGETSVQGAIDALADNRVSSDTGNSITIGNDGGAYFDSTIKPIVVTSADLILTAAHYTVIVLGDVDITLPDSLTTPTGRIYIIRNNSGQTIDILIDGSPIPPFTTLNDNEALWVQTDGNNWYQIN